MKPSLRERPAPDIPEFSSDKALLDFFGRRAGLENRLSTLLGLLQAAMTILLAWQVASMLDAAIYQSVPVLPDATDWLILSAALFTRVIAGNLQGRVGNRASIKVRDALRRFALQRCFGINIRLFPTFTAAEASNLLTTEIDRQRGYFADFVPQQQLAVLMPLAILIASATVSWLVPLIFLFTAPLVPVFMILVGSRAAEISRVNIQQLNRLGDLLADRLKNLQALQLARTTEQESDQLFKQSESYRYSTMRVLRLAFLSGTLLEFFSAVSVAIVAVYLGLFFLNKYEFGAYAGGYGMFEGIFLLMLAPEFYLPLRKMGALYHDRTDAIAMAEHLRKLDAVYRAEQLSGSPATVSVAVGETLQTIDVTGLQSGEVNRPVHAAVDFTLIPGDCLLLDGPSGSGKTTLLDTLAGLRPMHHGRIRVRCDSASDGESDRHGDNAPLNDMTPFQNPEWYARVGYLSQRPELLFASIRENLTLGRHFPDPQIEAALEQAQVLSLIHQLPGQLDYIISDSGGYLSGGQAQRIALARVFLHQPDLLLLDEPTANLDQVTADEFMSQLAQFRAQGGMLVMASHRVADRSFFNKTIAMQPADPAPESIPSEGDAR